MGIYQHSVDHRIIALVRLLFTVDEDLATVALCARFTRWNETGLRYQGDLLYEVRYSLPSESKHHPASFAIGGHMMQVLLDRAKFGYFLKGFRHPLDENYVVFGYESDDAPDDLRGREHSLSGMSLLRSFDS